jgi:hypothetical protein
MRPITALPCSQRSTSPSIPTARVCRLDDELMAAENMQYVAAGVVAMGILFMAVFSGIKIICDRQFGFLKEPLVAPVPRLEIMLGPTLAGAIPVRGARNPAAAMPSTEPDAFNVCTRDIRELHSACAANSTRKTVATVFDAPVPNPIRKAEPRVMRYAISSQRRSGANPEPQVSRRRRQAHRNPIPLTG